MQCIPASSQFSTVFPRSSVQCSTVPQSMPVRIIKRSGFPVCIFLCISLPRLYWRSRSNPTEVSYVILSRHWVKNFGRKDESPVWNNATVSEFSWCLIRQTASSVIESTSHFKNAPVKSIDNFPSQIFLPLRFTILGIFCVSNSCKWVKTPSLLRKPTIIRVTPSKKDWLQNLRSFLSKVTSSFSFVISFDVFNST